MVATLTACLYGGSSLHQEGSSGKKKSRQQNGLHQYWAKYANGLAHSGRELLHAMVPHFVAHVMWCIVTGGLPCLPRGVTLWEMSSWTQIRSDHSVSPPFLGSQASWRFNSSRHGTASGCRSHLLGVLEQSKRGWTFQNVFNAVKGINVNINFADSSCSNSPNEFARRAQKKMI